MGKAAIGEEIPLYTIYSANLGEINETDIECIEKAIGYKI